MTIGRKGSRSRRIGLGRWRYAATGGLLAFIALAVVLPYAVLALCSFLSFLTPRLKPSLFTFDNYRALFSEENLTPTFNSLAYSVFGGLGASVLYFGASLALRPLSGSWRRLADLTTIIPTAMPALVLGVGLVWAFVGLPLPIYGTAAILIIAYIIRFCGFGLRHASDALSRIAPDLAEAARLSGASPQRAALDVIAPLAVPAFLSLWTALFISIFMEISATIILYSPSSRTLPTVLWNDMASGSQTRAFAVACAQAFLIFAILALTDRKFGVLRDPAGR